jgi:hypothetical protein
MRYFYAISAVVMAAFLLAWLVPVALTQEQVPASPVPPRPVQPGQADQGLEYLNQGPVHEAYAEPITGQPQPGPVVPQQPPDPVDEVPPDQKPEGNDVEWIPGYWQWDDQNATFVWVSGIWRDMPLDKEWVPGFWNQVDGGWQWVPGYWADAGQQDVVYLPPPPPSIDSGPSVPATNPNDVYVPGVWVYRENRYLWRPGFFIAYNPNWVYIPAHYTWCPAGYVFVEGYWDYPLDNRGLLFAPALINRTLLVQPNWTYTPQYVIPASSLITALFVRPAYHSYFFGDYFAPDYQRRGYIPWVDYRIGRAEADPLFTHYRYRYRNNEDFIRGIQTLYTERREGRVARPPRTVRELAEEMRQGRADNHLSMVSSLRDAPRQGLRLQAIPREQLSQERQRAQQWAQVRTQRQRAETQVISQGGPVTRTGERPRTAKLELPRPARPAAQAPAQVRRPELPRVPQHEQRPIPQHQPLAPERASPHPQPRVEQRPGNQGRPAVRPGEAPNQPREAKPPNQVRPPANQPRPETQPKPPQQKEQRPPNEVRPPANHPRPEARPNSPQQKEQRPPTPTPKETRSPVVQQPGPPEAPPRAPTATPRPPPPAPREQRSAAPPQQVRTPPPQHPQPPAQNPQPPAHSQPPEHERR